jgi:hypothetical protein
MDVEAYDEMERVLEAHERRRQARMVCKSAKASHDRTVASGCRHTTSISRSEFDRAVSAKIRAEIRFKWLRIRFQEAYGPLSGELENRLAAQSRVHAAAAR